MKNILRSLVWASLAAFGVVGASAATLNIPSGASNDSGADVFTATYNSGSGNQTITIFCLDYVNSFTPGTTYSVNSSQDTSIANISATRYGTTAAGSFSFDTSSPNAGTAQERYALAGYLASTQYVSGTSLTAAQVTNNTNVQGAIWTLLDAGAGSAPASVNSAGAQSEIQTAINWYGTQSASQLATFESSFTILSDTAINGTATPARYSTGTQEFLTFSGAAAPVPEPSSFVLLGGGLILAGLVRPKKLAGLIRK